MCGRRVDLLIAMEMYPIIFLCEGDNVLFGVFILLFLDFFAKISIECVFTLLSSHEQSFSLNFICQNMANNISIVSSLDNFWRKMKFTAKDVLLKRI